MTPEVGDYLIQGPKFVSDQAGSAPTGRLFRPLIFQKWEKKLSLIFKIRIIFGDNNP
jgi:hypothetical protein